PPPPTPPPRPPRSGGPPPHNRNGPLINRSHFFPPHHNPRLVGNHLRHPRRKRHSIHRQRMSRRNRALPCNFQQHRASPPHLKQLPLHAPPRTLPRRLRPCQPGSENLDVCHFLRRVQFARCSSGDCRPRLSSGAKLDRLAFTLCLLKSASLRRPLPLRLVNPFAPLQHGNQ